MGKEQLPHLPKLRQNTLALNSTKFLSAMEILQPSHKESGQWGRGKSQLGAKG